MELGVWLGLHRLVELVCSGGRRAADEGEYVRKEFDGKSGNWFWGCAVSEHGAEDTFGGGEGTGRHRARYTVGDGLNGSERDELDWTRECFPHTLEWK